MFSKSNAQQNISTQGLHPIVDDDEFEEYDPAAFEANFPESPGFLEVSSDDQIVPGAWRTPRSPVRVVKSSGQNVTGQGRAAVSPSQKRPDSGQWEVYDPAAFERTPSEIAGGKETNPVRLASSTPPEPVQNMPSTKASPHRRTTKLGLAESAELAEVAGRTRSLRNDFVAPAERTLITGDLPSSAEWSPRRLASPKSQNIHIVEHSAQNGQQTQVANQGDRPLGHTSTQQAVGQGESGGWAAFDAAYAAKFGEAIPPSGTAAVARKLGNTQPLAVQDPNNRSPDTTMESLTATLTLHSSGNTTLSHRLASPQSSIVPNLGNKIQHLPSEADQPLKEWPFKDLRISKPPARDNVDQNFRLPKAEPAPGALKEWPFKGFKVSAITDRDKSGSGHKQSGSGAGIGLQSAPPPTEDLSTIYAESTLVLCFSFPLPLFPFQ